MFNQQKDCSQLVYNKYTGRCHRTRGNSPVQNARFEGRSYPCDDHKPTGKGGRCVHPEEESWLKQCLGSPFSRAFCGMSRPKNQSWEDTMKTGYVPVGAPTGLSGGRSAPFSQEKGDSSCKSYVYDSERDLFRRPKISDEAVMRRRFENTQYPIETSIRTPSGTCGALQDSYLDKCLQSDAATSRCAKPVPVGTNFEESMAHGPYSREQIAKLAGGMLRKLENVKGGSSKYMKKKSMKSRRKKSMKSHRKKSAKSRRKKSAKGSSSKSMKSRRKKSMKSRRKKSMKSRRKKSMKSRRKKSRK